MHVFSDEVGVAAHPATAASAVGMPDVLLDEMSIPGTTVVVPPVFASAMAEPIPTWPEKSLRQVLRL